MDDGLDEALAGGDSVLFRGAEGARGVGAAKSMDSSSGEPSGDAFLAGGDMTGDLLAASLLSAVDFLAGDMSMVGEGDDGLLVAWLSCGVS